MKKKLVLRDLGAENCINLLQPIRCDCGCGGYANLIIEDKPDYNVFTVADSLIKDTDCNNAWIFIIEHWAISGAYTSKDGIKYFSTATPENKKPIIDFREQIKFIRNIIREEEPHCIGVLQQTEDGSFRIVMETIYDR